jgi:DNA-binding LacI/PurR family transcriptional regulator
MPKREMGTVAASRLLDLIQHPENKLPPLKLVLPTSLIVRGTT